MNKIKEIWKSKLVIVNPVKLLIYLALASSTFYLVSCKTPTRPEINGRIFLNNTPIPKETCDKNKELYQYGFFRRLNDGKLEFISFCAPEAREWVSMHNKDFQDLLDKYVPKD